MAAARTARALWISVAPQRLRSARHQIDIALRYADAIGQEKAELEGLARDVDALNQLMYDTSMPLIQRLAQAETGTKG
jgi:hydroxypyruvate isomerase